MHHAGKSGFNVVWRVGVRRGRGKEWEGLEFSFHQGTHLIGFFKPLELEICTQCALSWNKWFQDGGGCLQCQCISAEASTTSIGRLRKSGGQKIDIISLLLNKFS